jgi:hypothetical protein
MRVIYDILNLQKFYLRMEKSTYVLNSTTRLFKARRRFGAIYSLQLKGQRSRAR